MSQNNLRGDSEEMKRLRNKLAQTKHREKRKIAEKENEALRRRIRELEAELARSRKAGGRGGREVPMDKSNCCCHCQKPINCAENPAHVQQQQQVPFTQSHPANPPQFHANYMFPQLRLSRSLSIISNSSIPSRSSSVFSVASNFENYTPNYQEEEYVPNGQTLMGMAIDNGNLNGNGAVNGHAHSGHHNFAYQPMPPESALPSYNGQHEGIAGDAQNGRPSSSVGSFYTTEEFDDLITPLARGFAASNEFSLDDLDLVTPRPRAVTD